MASPYEAPRSLSFLGTPQSVRILWASDQCDAEISNWKKQHFQEKDIRDAGEFRTHNLSKRKGADLRLRQHGHRDWFYIYMAANFGFLPLEWGANNYVLKLFLPVIYNFVYQVWNSALLITFRVSIFFNTFLELFNLCTISFQLAKCSHIRTESC
jgi:hypothetical protein